MPTVRLVVHSFFQHFASWRRVLRAFLLIRINESFNTDTRDTEREGRRNDKPQERTVGKSRDLGE